MPTDTTGPDDAEVRGGIAALPRRASEAVAGAFDGQRGHLFSWVPVFLAIGIGGYFLLPVEPEAAAWWGLAGALTLSAGALYAGLWRWPPAVALVLMLAGVGLAGLRTAAVTEPILGFRYYGPVEGRIVTVDRSGSDKVRLTLDRVALDDVWRPPSRVRVSLHDPVVWFDPVPGMTVMTTAHLSPPEGPVEPEGFDFARNAYFKGIGAVGYARTPALVLDPGDGGWSVGRVRMALSAAVRATLPGETGAFAAAITTGDRSGMGQDTLADLRASNLAHLLAISGLHMGLLTGVVFVALRLALVAVPGWALTLPVKKIAAVGALAAGAFYLAMSGGNVATQRAYIMVAVMFGAVLLDRRALTLRAVALAAVIVLALRPEALTGPGFQMSFAATTALVAVFRALRGIAWMRPGGGLPGWARAVLGTVISSAVAGAATAPVAAAHFNQIAQFGLVANLLSVPLMGILVMPAAVLAAALAPLGLGWVGLYLMAPGIDWILFVAHRVAELDGSVTLVPTPGPWVLPVFAIGALWTILWQGRARWAGPVAVALAGVLWAGAERPALLISPDGGLSGVMVDGVRTLNKPRGQGFAAGSWLENDGDGASQEEAAARTGMAGPRDERRFDIGGLSAVHVAGRGGAERAAAACDTADLVIISAEVARPLEGPCMMIDESVMRQSGAVALDVVDGVPHVVSAREVVGDRPWSQR